MENEIEAKHGKIKVAAPETGIFKVYLNEIMLHVTGYRTLLTWNCLFSITEYGRILLRY